MIKTEDRKRKRKPLTSRVTGRIDEAMKERLGKVADKTGLDESDLVRLALNQFLPVLEAERIGSHLVHTENGLQAHKGAAPECAADRELEEPDPLEGEEESNKAEVRRQKDEGENVQLPTSNVELSRDEGGAV